VKKYVAVAAVAVLAAFAAPAFAATNPFMDVPLNHWAYDAIGQLAAQGILSGYPDGTYKGKQPTTRYEMASALARALAVVDLTKASKADVEMLKRLVIEFKDELDALGVKVDELDKRVAVIESRLGGWKITGVLRNDLIHADSVGTSDNGPQNKRGYGDLARARLFMERWFGEDESIHFFARLEGSDARYTNAARAAGVEFTRFYAEVPAFYDTKLILGRYQYDFEAAYYLDSGSNPFSKHMGAGTGSWLSDRTVDAFGIQKNFGLGSVTFYAAHPLIMNRTIKGADRTIAAPAPAVVFDGYGVWELALNAQLQFNEQFGFDLGVQAFIGDDAATNSYDDIKLNNLWTAYGGFRFNFTDSIAFKGLYYHQASDYDIASTGVNVNTNDADAFRVLVDIRQEVLGFTSLWLEYNKLDQGFFLPSGRGDLFNDGDFGNFSAAGRVVATADNFIINDLSIWRVAAQQQWNDKWSTFLYFANFDVDTISDFSQFGLGVNYQLNPSVLLGLSYLAVDYDNAFALNVESQIRFRTQVTF
jgi:hypothetical protein